LSKREDYLETRRPLWNAAGGYENFQRKQNTIKCGRWRGKNSEKWLAYMKSYMQRYRAEKKIVSTPL